MCVTIVQIQLPSQLGHTLYTVLVMSKDKIKFWQECKELFNVLFLTIFVQWVGKSVQTGAPKMDFAQEASVIAIRIPQ